MNQVKYPESSDTEYKECRGHKTVTLPEDLWQSIAAFSNTHGGKLFLGVTDDGSIIGLSAGELDKLQKDLSTLVKGKFNTEPKIYVRTDEGYLEVEVAELEPYNKPIYSKKAGPKKIYIRRGSTNMLASDDEMRSLFAESTGGGENQVIYGDLHELVDEVKIDDYIAKTRLKDIQFDSLESKLQKLKALRDSKLTTFGLIAFGKDSIIDELLDNAYIDFKIFAGTSKVDANNLENIYAERIEFHGNIAKQFTQAFEHIKARIPKSATFDKTTGLRKDEYILPEDAIREALANSIAHRDYAIQSSCVNIDLYSDRIEFSNPGESLVAIADLENTPSKARNPRLIEFLKAYDITDKTARGIPIIYQAARTQGLRDPQFENISGNFRAILHFSSPHSEADEQWVGRIATNFKLKDTQKNALVHIKNNGSISNREYCEINHMNNLYDDKQARRELSKLCDYGIITKEGGGPGTKYKLNIAS